MRGQQITDLKQQRVMVLGAGSAGVGVATAISQGMEKQGLTSEAALNNFYVFDNYGLLGEGRQGLDNEQAPFCRSDLPDKMTVCAPCHPLPYRGNALCGKDILV